MSRKLNGFNLPQWVRWLVVLGLLGAALLGRGVLDESSASATTGDVRVAELFEGRTSGEMVTVEGMIDRVLDDDNRGSRHQRFIVRLGSGATLLVAHNIDLAERVPLRAQDRIFVHGEYEWNAQGGLLHWTHHDPNGRRSGGWIEHEGVRYR